MGDVSSTSYPALRIAKRLQKSSFLAYLKEQRLDYPPNVFREDALAGGIRMDAIPLIELGISADAFQEERNQCRPVLFCDRAEDSAERADVIIAGNIRKLHAGKDDRRAGLLCPHLIDDRLEIRPDLFDRHAAKGVVDSELKNKNIDLVVGAKNGRQPAQSAGG